MIRLFTRDRPKWLPRLVSKAVRKLLRVTWVGHGVVSKVYPTSRNAVTTIQYAGARQNTTIAVMPRYPRSPDQLNRRRRVISVCWTTGAAASWMSVTGVVDAIATAPPSAAAAGSAPRSRRGTG